MLATADGKPGPQKEPHTPYPTTEAYKQSGLNPGARKGVGVRIPPAALDAAVAEWQTHQLTACVTCMGCIFDTKGPDGPRRLARTQRQKRTNNSNFDREVEGSTPSGSTVTGP